MQDGVAALQAFKAPPGSPVRNRKPRALKSGYFTGKKVFHSWATISFHLKLRLLRYLMNSSDWCFQCAMVPRMNSSGCFSATTRASNRPSNRGINAGPPVFLHDELGVATHMLHERALRI